MSVTSKSSLRYMRVAEVLTDRVAGLGPNTLLPTENELALEFAVSRVTVRQALRVLEQSGLVTRARGRGTVVCAPKFTRNLYPIRALEDDLDQQGIDHETRVLDFQRKFSPPEAIRSKLQLGKTASVGRLLLVRLVNGKVICFEKRYCVPSLARQLAPEKLLNNAVVALLSQAAKSKIEVVEFETEISPAGEEVAVALGITPGSLMVQNTFAYFHDNGTPIEAGTVSYRIDRCKFRAVGRLLSPGGKGKELLFPVPKFRSQGIAKDNRISSSTRRRRS
jgi:GntR family transcriptional regulator